MIQLFHNNSNVVEVNNTLDGAKIFFDTKKSIVTTLFDIAESYPNEFIIWSHQDLKGSLNTESFHAIFHHKLIMASYNTAESYSISKSIGYIDQNPFVKINREVKYPTWLMSSNIGGINASVLNKFRYLKVYKLDIALFLNTLAKAGQKAGVLCYSEPSLLKEKDSVIKVNAINIFSFVKSNYKARWIYLLFLNLMIYEKKFPFIQFIQGIVSKKINHSEVNLDTIEVQSSKELPEFTLDVIIPTLGRKEYLLNVLKDLAKQTVLPTTVIIIEQQIDGVSELEYLYNEEWPFQIKHKCIDQFGACNARNLAIELAESNWIFFADDDVRIKETIVEDAFSFLSKYGGKGVTINSQQEGDKVEKPIVIQFNSFGGGSSIICRTSVSKVFFKKEYEFGYGEDADYGMQLRNKGMDILYNPTIHFLHLKAPIGGFRKKVQLPWLNESADTLPKPSPTVMVLLLKHYAKEQLHGYKTNLFIKFYNKQKTKNPITYFRSMKRKWNSSIHWAHKIINEGL